MSQEMFINPKTGRKIKVGAPLYKRIMKEIEESNVKQEDLFYNEEEYIAVPDLEIFVRKTSNLFKTLSLTREYDTYRNSLVLNLKETPATSDMDPIWKDLYKIGNCHELWLTVLSQVHPSMVGTLRLVFKFSCKS